MTLYPKILLLAPYADPDDVGEAWSTYQWLKGITAYYPSVTIIGMHKKGRSIEGLFPENKVISWPEIPLFSKFERFNAMLKPSYVLFYNKARKWIKSELNRGERWDLIHQISPLALRYPHPAFDLKIPYILGPLAGSIIPDKSFDKEMGSENWFTKLRFLDGMRFKFDPLLRKSYLNSSLLIGVAPYVKEILKDISISKFALMNETGVYSINEKKGPCGRSNDNTFRLLFVGRLTRSKGVRDFVRALGLIKDTLHREIVFDVLGDGEDRRQCEEEVRQLGIERIVKFWGKVNREKVSQFYRNADLFVFPSIKEPSGNVVLEAMCFGLPMIVCANGGPGHTVKETFGVLITPEDPDSYAKQLALSLCDLMESPQRLAAMRVAAIDEIKEHHLWPIKIDKLMGLYQEVLSNCR